MAYVENVAAFLLHVLTLGPGTHIFNYVDGPDMDMNTLVEFVRSSLNQRGSVPHLPMAAALAGGHLLDAVARLSGRTFPISAIRIRKFSESTKFRAERVAESGFAPPFSLNDGLSRTLRFEFPAQATTSD